MLPWPAAHYPGEGLRAFHPQWLRVYWALSVEHGEGPCQTPPRCGAWRGRDVCCTAASDQKAGESSLQPSAHQTSPEAKEKKTSCPQARPTSALWRTRTQLRGGGKTTSSLASWTRPGTCTSGRTSGCPEHSQGRCSVCLPAPRDLCINIVQQEHSPDPQQSWIQKG